MNYSSTRKFSRQASGGRPFARRRFGGGGNRWGARPLPRHNIADFIARSQKDIDEGVIQEIRHDFADFNLDHQLEQNISRLGYLKPTPIQDKTIPEILTGRDVIGLANTGTGKTASFLIPLLNQLISNPGGKVLVVAPTRELAIQIDKSLRDLKVGYRIWSVLCIGGTSTYRQVQDLRRHHDFVIGTPGRLKDMADRGLLNLADCRYVVLDEVDRMLDMGFLPAVRELLAQLPRKRQSLFFSATLSPKLHQLASTFLANPVTISVKTMEVTSLVQQSVIQVRETEKVLRLLELLGQDDYEKVLIFGRTKRGVHKLMFQLRDQGIQAESIHGDKSQNFRKQALNDFRTNRVRVLVATDVAARGLDVSDITHVINYDLPETYEDYVHRIGRTGRANKQGVAVTFVS